MASEQEKHTMKIDRSRCSNYSMEKFSAADQAEVPWKGAPERTRASSCPDPITPRGTIGELGYLGMQF